MNDDLSHLLNHLGEERELGYHAVVPPVVQSGNFAYTTVAAMRAIVQQEMEKPLYTRGANPTVAILRKKIAALEHAEDALIFSSGSAAIAAAVMSFVKAGDHIVCVNKPYSWTKKLLVELLARFNVDHTFVMGIDPETLRERAIRLGVAGGQYKSKPIVGASRAGFINMLITDEVAATGVIQLLKAEAGA